MTEIWLFFVFDYILKNALTIIGLLLFVGVPLTGYLYWRKKRLKTYFKVIWKKSSSLKHEHLLEMRPYDPYYLQRDEDELIRKSISAGSNVVIFGPPLSGKTRAAYEALTKLNKPCDVLIARNTDINLEKFFFPKHFKFWRAKILVVDDLHRFVELQNFDHLFRVAAENRTSVIATCRSGFECEKAEKKMAERGMDLETIFGQNVVALGKVSEQVAKGVASKTDRDWGQVKFDGTVGSVFMRLSEMETRFNECDSPQKTILRVLRNLYVCGVYQENQVFPLEWVKTASKKVGLEGKDYEWTGWLESLAETELLLVEKDSVRVEEIYLEHVVKPETEVSDLELFESMLSSLSGVADALVNLGNRAYSVGETHLDRAKYMKLAIRAYQEALKVYTLERFPMHYGVTQNNLGNAYRILAEVESKAENCKRAIVAFQEALKVRTLERFPMQYSNTQNNLGNAYSRLAEVEAKGENCRRAIEAYERALKVRTLERFPMDYGIGQSNLGNLYGILAEVEDKAQNCKRAIKACEEALKVYTLEHFPMQYAAAQNNLGNAYSRLAEVEAKEENCRRAIEAYEEALKVRTLGRFPLDYGMTQSNLGTAYRTLAAVESKAENCQRAIVAFQEALKVRTLERFPLDYGMTQNNLGNAYRTLAEVEGKAENCNRAIEAFQEALKVYTKKDFPEVFVQIQQNLENLLDFCERV